MFERAVWKLEGGKKLPEEEEVALRPLLLESSVAETHKSNQHRKNPSIYR